ncbi:hypothetical protein [Oceanirhabdus sp. W0125-5]|uniref:hypothetical protein n=1 Tax=Oceanirhabdus sp. W0125-5 TaxID=2999116 RepID=UPI0022F2A763|nr:hypothetical protein [Oceanirhabdus sp. W0125-5]WBW95024.1 hypothetical protein OW730_15155 [Oceanirhabdus sp. W0125-5]
MRRFFKILCLITVLSLFFHSIWEYFQCEVFYDVEDSTGHIFLMLSATFGDIMMTVILYLILSIVNKDCVWFLYRWELKEYIIIILYSLTFSFYFEANALYTNRWGYTKAMPLFYKTNIGLLPVLQLLILFPLTFLTSKIILKYLLKDN